MLASKPDPYYTRRHYLTDDRGTRRLFFIFHQPEGTLITAPGAWCLGVMRPP